LIATLDGNQITKKQSLLAAIRAVRFEPLTEKLQCQENLFPFLRSWGTDNEDGMGLVRPFFHEIELWSVNNQKQGSP